MARPRPLARLDHRRGKVLVLVALTLPALIGVSAFTLDGGMLLTERRHAQATADAAAMAGAVEIYKGYPTYQGSDPGGAAMSNALAVAAANGYTNDTVNSVVTVNIPPQSSVTPKPNGTPGLFNGQAGYVEVIVNFKQQRGFSAIWGSDRLTTGARAIARGSWQKPRGGVVLLHPTDPGSLTIGGQGSSFVNVLGGDFVVNSSAPDAITINGGNSRLAGKGFYIKGSPGVTDPSSLKEPDGTTNSSHIYPNSPRLPDPFRHLSEPTTANSQTATLIRKMQGNSVTAEWTSTAQPRIDQLVQAGKLTATEAANFTNFYLLQPGMYSGNLGFTGNSTLVLFQQATGGGIFHLTSGMTSNSAYLMMDPSSSGGIMLYNSGSGSSNQISLGGATGKVWLEPPTSGNYENMMIFQSRLDGVNGIPLQPESRVPDISLSGGAQFDIAGSIYSARGRLSLSGSAVGNKVGSQHVSSKMTVGGGANLNITYSSTTVANERIIKLVE